MSRQLPRWQLGLLYWTKKLVGMFSNSFEFTVWFCLVRQMPGRTNEGLRRSAPLEWRQDQGRKEATGVRPIPDTNRKQKQVVELFNLLQNNASSPVLAPVAFFSRGWVTLQVSQLLAKLCPQYLLKFLTESAPIPRFLRWDNLASFLQFLELHCLEYFPVTTVKWLRTLQWPLPSSS